MGPQAETVEWPLQAEGAGEASALKLRAGDICMRFKGTWVLLLLFVALGGWVYFTDIRGREEREKAEAAEGLALPVEADDIEQVSLIYPDRTLAARRGDSGWEFVTPMGLEADQDGWDRVAANVGRVERGTPVAEDASDLSIYGLAAPDVVVQVHLADGRTEEIRFGNANPAGSSSYTALGSNSDVFLTATTWRGMFEKDADDLRDKTILRFEQSEIDHIELTGSNVQLVREDGKWFIEGPPRLRADDAEVASFLSTLSTTRATGFGPSNQSGFEQAPNRVVLGSGDSGEEHVLVFGPEVGGDANLVYARDSSRDPVFTVRTSLRDRAVSPAPVWRDKTIAAFDSGGITGIEIARAGQPPVQLDLAGDQWTMADGRPASKDRIDAMLNAFDFQKASEVLDTPAALGAYGLDPPRIHVVLRDGSGVALDCGFGDAAGDGGVYWNSTEEPAVKVVPDSVMTPFDVDADALADAGSEDG